MSLPILKGLRESAGLSQEELADRAGISTSQVSRYESGKRDPTLSDLISLAGELRTSVSTLIAEDEELQVIPVVSWVSAGRLALGEQLNHGDWEKTVAVSDLPHGRWIALVVRGDSMDRIAPEGSIIFINRDDTELIDGRCYIFLHEDEATFKLYRHKPPRLQPYSTNPDHRTIWPSDEINVIGRVRRVITDLW